MPLQVYAVQVDISLSYPWESWLTWVSLEKQAKLLRLKQPEDRIRGLIADLLVRNVLMQQHGIPNDWIRFQLNPYGKLFLPDSSVHFNVSHSGEWVVAAFDDRSVGIDVEAMEPLDYRLLSERFFTDNECRQILQEEESKQLRTFYSVWTSKESYVKAVGGGLSIDLKSFTFCNQDMKILSKSISNGGVWFVKSYDISSRYNVSVCSQSAAFPDQPVILPIEELIGYFQSSS